ncbi:hypothetical protein ACTMTI_50630 [Nonomuraea sp. H19]|uniref:hypothetical protein n=1 Tax=Nonomuraea sp. H19 TaxID=3452206 RepID=UPI003F8920A4
MRIGVVHLLHASFRRAALQRRDAMGKALMSLAQEAGAANAGHPPENPPRTPFTSKAV